MFKSKIDEWSHFEILDGTLNLSDSKFRRLTVITQFERKEQNQESKDPENPNNRTWRFSFSFLAFNNHVFGFGYDLVTLCRLWYSKIDDIVISTHFVIPRRLNNFKCFPFLSLTVNENIIWRIDRNFEIPSFVLFVSF